MARGADGLGRPDPECWRHARETPPNLSSSMACEVSTGFERSALVRLLRRTPAGPLCSTGPRLHCSAWITRDGASGDAADGCTPLADPPLLENVGDANSLLPDDPGVGL